jgi:hypothetical protein
MLPSSKEGGLFPFPFSVLLSSEWVEYGGSEDTISVARS